MPAMRFLAAITAAVVMVVARFLTAVRGEWEGCAPAAVQRIYFANHSSHADFVLIWTVLPPLVRPRVRPVAAADCWLEGPIRRFLIREVFAGVLIDRRSRRGVHETSGGADAIDRMTRALDRGDSLILFPEGTRNSTDSDLLPLRSGIYRLARERPAVELVPVWVENLNRVLPKGEFLPVPLLCTVTFGTPMKVGTDAESEFLERARLALLALKPPSYDNLETRPPCPAIPKR